jgi:F-type H+-transporting ATPase subunit alpha
VAIMGEDTGIKEGDIVKRTGKIAQVPVGEAVLGRVVDGTGQPIDGKGPIEGAETRRVKWWLRVSSPVKGVHEPCYTGLKAVDGMTPVGRGQRELIIGDRQIGKTPVPSMPSWPRRTPTFTASTWLPARRNPRWPRLWTCWKNTVPWNTPRSFVPPPPTRPPCSTSPPMPECAMGEYFRDKGQHALIIYDDLSKQAAAYRQVSLLLRRPPGREAFPATFSTTIPACWSAPPS